VLSSMLLLWAKPKRPEVGVTGGLPLVLPAT